MSLAIALNNALTGLSINQKSLAVLSQNIANANTKNYSRQVVNQAAVYLAGIGSGVTAEEIARKVDAYLTRSVRTQNGVVARANIGVDYADRIQLFLGQPGSQNNTASQVTNFFSSLQNLALTPESTTQRVNVINTAVTLTRSLEQLTRGLHDLRFQADQDIDQSLDTLNVQLTNLRQLNRAISTDLSLGRSVVGLLDQRDALLKELGATIDIQTFEKENGEVHLITAGGVSLLDESLYQFSYVPATSSDSFANNIATAPVTLSRVDDTGAVIGTPVIVVTAGSGSSVSTIFTTGKIKGLLDVRDRQIPNQLAQLDELAAKLRDEFNAVHNRGTSFPGVRSLTGTRALFPEEFSQWSGQIRIGVLDANGAPIGSKYPDEISGSRPLTLDLSKLNTGGGEGQPSLQGLIDEINAYLGPPGNRAVVGALNNIRLVSNSVEMPTVPASFSFDLDVENISPGDANLFISSFQVLDSTNTDITAVSADVPRLAIDAGYTTTAGSTTVTLNTSAPHGFIEGQTVFLSDPSGPVDGILATQLGGYFTISNVTATSFDITAGAPAFAGGSFGAAAQTATPAYDTIEAGEYRRTRDNGIVTLDLTGNAASPFYLVRVNVGVQDEDGNIVTSQLTYRVDNTQSGLLNHRYSVQTVTGGGTMVQPQVGGAIARALLVDADGNEITKVNGEYDPAAQGFLRIEAVDDDHVIALDSLNSVEQGRPNSDPPLEGTGRSFSHYFELNNFFAAYNTGAASAMGSALNLRVEDRLQNDPNKISLGRLVQSQPTPGANPVPLYTYERFLGDNTVIDQLAQLGSALLAYPAAGGLGATAQTFDGYAAQIIGAAAANAASIRGDQANAQILLDGYNQRADSISGVNLDEELANTIIYQNAYTASARVVTVTDELFAVLLDTF